MKKFAFSFLLAIAYIFSIFFMQDTQTETEYTEYTGKGLWESVQTGPFNDVRVACIPAHAARGYDKTMQKLGVNQKITTMRSNYGKTEEYVCYVQYLLDQKRDIYATQNCGLGRNFDRNKFDFVYGSFQQTVCGVIFLVPDMIEDKVKNPLNYAIKFLHMHFLMDYLKTGALPQPE